jgi:hypothetical protein
MATMPLRQVALPYPRITVRPRRSEAHWFFVLGFFLAYALCRMLT